jgi:hypothetical protein
MLSVVDDGRKKPSSDQWAYKAIYPYVVLLETRGSDIASLIIRTIITVKSSNVSLEYITSIFRIEE